MICKRYFPGFIDVDDSEMVEHKISMPQDALQIDWIKQRIARGANVIIDGAYVMSIYPNEKYVIATLRTDDGIEYIK